MRARRWTGAPVIGPLYQRVAMPMECATRFTKWGPGLFLFGIFLTLGIIAHQCAGARWSTGDLFIASAMTGDELREASDGDTAA